jgi:hypothetical protein
MLVSKEEQYELEWYIPKRRMSDVIISKDIFCAKLPNFASKLSSAIKTGKSK